MRVDPSGKVYVFIGVTAQGQGHATTLAQIAAQELGANFEDVIVQAGDTTQFPFGMGTGGSRVMANSGPAVAQTAREVKDKAQRVAAELLEARRSHSTARRPSSPACRNGACLSGARVGAVKSRPEPTGERRTPAPISIRHGTGPSAHGPVVAWMSSHAAVARAYAWSTTRARINPDIVETGHPGGEVQGIPTPLEELVYDETDALTALMDYVFPVDDGRDAVALNADR